MRGENVGITPRRSRSAVLQTQHQHQPVSTQRISIEYVLSPTFKMEHWNENCSTVLCRIVNTIF